MDGNTGMGKLSKKLRSQGTVLGTFVLVFWLVEIVDWILLRGALDSFGVKPRVVAGLWGILFAPFLHAGFGHLLANTVPFLVLGWFVMLKNRRDFYFVTAMAAVVSGLGIWLIGPSRSVHLGASGLVFG
jgi:membrane associated rhomboid family serine protease